MKTRQNSFTPITFSYDAEADILYVAFGKARPGIGLLINDSLLLRVDQEMKELIGFSIFDYRQTTRKERLELYGLSEMSAKAKNFALSLLQTSPLNRFFRLIRNNRNALYVKPALDDIRIENLLLAA